MDKVLRFLNFGKNFLTVRCLHSYSMGVDEDSGLTQCPLKLVGFGVYTKYMCTCNISIKVTFHLLAKLLFWHFTHCPGIGTVLHLTKAL